MTNLVSVPGAALSENVQRLLHIGADIAKNADADNTMKAYASDWQDYTRFCELNGMAPIAIDPQLAITAVSTFITDMLERGLKVSTITRRVSAISRRYQDSGMETPTQNNIVRKQLKGIRKEKGSRPDKKTAAVIDDIRLMVETLPDTFLSKRDRALLLVGFAGAFRRSELVGLDVEDLDFGRHGLTVTLRHSKTDQEGEGYTKGIAHGLNAATCPVGALQDWLTASGITSGPVFRAVNRHGQLQDGRLSDKAIALVVKRAAAAAGMDPEKYSGHSLRSGLITTSAMAGLEERDIMRQSGHKSVAVMRSYIHEGSLFRNNVTTRIGL